MNRKPALWESECNFFSATSYYEGLLQDIDGAQESILLECYIFELDPLGERVVRHLLAAKNRGLEVKVLVDGIGSMNTLDSLLDTFREHDIEIKVYHPLPWDFSAYPYAIKQGGYIDRFIHFLTRINNRNHRKLCVIDSRIAWTGSYNICMAHLPENEGGEGWKDHAVRVSGPQVESVTEEFRKLWQQKRLGKLSHSIPLVISTLNPIRRHQKIKRIIKDIEKARNRIWVANGYFAPHHSIRSALIRARKRGVDVSIIVGEKSDIIFFSSLTRSFYADLLRHDISIYEWPRKILHSKIMLIDEFCYTGSTNLNSRSHFHDLELDIMVCNKNTIAEIEKQMLSDFNSSLKIEPQFIIENGFYIALVSIIPRTLRYWF